MCKGIGQAETSMFLDDGDETKSFCHGMQGVPSQFWENVGDSYARDKSQDSHGPLSSGSLGPLQPHAAASG